MTAQTYLFPCLEDDFGVLLHDPGDGRHRLHRRAGSGAGRGGAEERPGGCLSPTFWSRTIIAITPAGFRS